MKRLVLTVTFVALLVGTAAAAPISPDLTKWSQPIFGLGTFYQDEPVYLGWDIASDFRTGPIVADDWQCKSPTPVTDVHWWGSYPVPTAAPVPVPAAQPLGFAIQIWTDVPATIDTPSQPGRLLYQDFVYDYKETFVGYDLSPWTGEVQDAAFQYNATLNTPFEQEPGTIYWLSIAAIMQDNETGIWGWKTRPHFFNDDAVIANVAAPSLPFSLANSQYQLFEVVGPQGESWDMAFELPPVPEPATLLLLGSAALTFAAIRRRRRL